MSLKSTAELLEYTRLTLRLIEQHPHREEDAQLAHALTLVLQRYIAELEQQATSRTISLRAFKTSEPTSK
jgi:hypothetical protein